ncbi:MAG: DUF1501 domain-containing protein [Planctomycetaceae bacterium]
MITMLGSPRRCCDGITRRESLQAGAIAALGGLSLPKILAAETQGLVTPGPAKNVIMLFLLGGAATQDMYDLKPEGPSETRGEFKPISTNVPGIDICEHLPMTAQWMHKVALVRSLNHKAGCHNCLPCYTGWELPPLNQHPTDNDAPSMGSVLSYMDGGRADFPPYVFMPNWLGWGQAFRRAGPYGGFLGSRFDALTTECEPYMMANPPYPPLPGTPHVPLGKPALPYSSLQEGVTVDRLNSRKTLLTQIDEQMANFEAGQAIQSFDRNQQQAFNILTSSKLREAFDLSLEDPKVVERYGDTLFGNSCLIARRLLEQGTRFVNVTWDLYWDRLKIDFDAWDTHTRNFDILKKNKLPGFDKIFTALLEDLTVRGMLDETLILVISEMGRTPRVNGNAGRDHWTFNYGCMFAGAGIRGGSVYGESDSQAAYPKNNPVSNADVVATVYQALGISPEYRVPDRTNRPVEVAHGGHPILEIMQS